VWPPWILWIRGRMHGNPVTVSKTKLPCCSSLYLQWKVTINLFSQLACLVRSILYFIEKYRVIQSKTKTYRMRWLHLLIGDVHGTLICILWLIHDICNRSTTSCHKPMSMQLEVTTRSPFTTASMQMHPLTPITQSDIWPCINLDLDHNLHLDLKFGCKPFRRHGVPKFFTSDLVATLNLTSRPSSLIKFRPLICKISCQQTFRTHAWVHTHRRWMGGRTHALTDGQPER